jgi:hypothetical protein
MTDRKFPNRKDNSSSLLSFGACCAASVALISIATLGGCGGEPEEQVVVAPPPPPPPVVERPVVTPIETLMAQLGIDSRVRLDEADAPDNDPARIALLTFFDGFVRGDHMRVADMLVGPDLVELERMVERGAWTQATEAIDRVDLRTGRNEFGDDAVLAMFHVGFDFEPQLWTYEVSDLGSEFAAEPTPPGIVNRLSGSDWIAAWYRILQEEMALADEPDEQVAIRSVNHDNTESIEGSSGGAAPSGSPFQPSGPGRRPVQDPIEAPGRWPGSSPSSN